MIVNRHTNQTPIVGGIDRLALRFSRTVSFTEEYSRFCFIYLMPTDWTAFSIIGADFFRFAFPESGECDLLIADRSRDAQRSFSAKRRFQRFAQKPRILLRLMCRTRMKLRVSRLASEPQSAWNKTSSAGVNRSRNLTLTCHPCAVRSLSIHNGRTPTIRQTAKIGRKRGQAR